LFQTNNIGERKITSFAIGGLLLITIWTFGLIKGLMLAFVIVFLFYFCLESIKSFFNPPKEKPKAVKKSKSKSKDINITFDE
jgi:hypothetical protein